MDDQLAEVELLLLLLLQGVVLHVRAERLHVLVVAERHVAPDAVASRTGPCGSAGPVASAPAAPAELHLRLVLVQLDERLRDEHEGHREDRHAHEHLGEGSAEHGVGVLLPHGHGDHRVDDAGRVVHRGHPLVEDHVVHEAEEADHEHHHGDALAEEVRRVALVHGVGEAEEETDGHLRDADDDGELHLHGVHEHELVLRAVPRGVDAEGVRSHPSLVPDVRAGDRLERDHLPLPRVDAGRVLPAGVEEVEAEREEVVVEEAGVHAEDTHHGQDVPGFVELRDAELELVGLPDGVDAQRKEHGPVAYVAVHHSEEEGEGDDGEERGVDLAVLGEPVRVHEVLEDPGELVLADVRGRILPRLRPVRHEHRAGVAVLPGAVLDEEGADVVLLLGRVPAVGAKVHVTLEEVERRVERLLLDAEHPPLLDQRVAVWPRHLEQRGGLAAHEGLVRLQEPLLVLDLNLKALEEFLRRLPAGGPAVRVDAVRGADLRDLLAHGGDRGPRAVVLEVDDEDGLVHLAARLGVLHGLEDLLEVDEGVAARGPVEVAREAVLVGLRDDAGDVAKHGLQGTPLPALLVVEQGSGRLVLELLVLALRAPQGPRSGGPGGDLRHGDDGGLDDVALLERRVAPGGEVRVVLLELDELPVDLLEARLDLVELVLVGILQEASDVVLNDLVVGDPVEFVGQEPKNPLHLVDSLDVLLVRAMHVARVHVLELHLGARADEVDELARAVDRQHERAVLHLF
mmetsp:Transcript_60124/g.158160  ORF Transcript_60124/g.158160 Transcript_60124/m.158160 type:complete len:742 (+) Transcript_60124:648-2873(+)